MANLGPLDRASALILKMDPVAREVRMAVGNDQIVDPDVATKILRAPNDYFAPDDIASIYREFKRAARTTDEFLVRFDPPPTEKRDRGCKWGFRSPGTSVSILRIKNAPLFRTDKSPVLASAQGNFGIAAAARRTRRSFGAGKANEFGKMILLR